MILIIVVLRQVLMPAILLLHLTLRSRHILFFLISVHDLLNLLVDKNEYRLQSVQGNKIKGNKK